LVNGVIVISGSVATINLPLIRIVPQIVDAAPLLTQRVTYPIAASGQLELGIIDDRLAIAAGTLTIELTPQFNGTLPDAANRTLFVTAGGNGRVTLDVDNAAVKLVDCSIVGQNTVITTSPGSPNPSPPSAVGATSSCD